MVASSTLRLIAASIALLAAGATARAQDIRIGVLAFRGSEKAAQEFEPTLRHIAASLGGRKVVMRPFDLDGMRQAVAEKALDFVITNPGDYIDLESRFGVTRIATLETRTAGAPIEIIGSVLIAPNKPNAPAAIADLAGKRLAVVSRQAFGGYRVFWREMDDIGLSPSRLDAIVETGFPMQRVVAALRNGEAEIGVPRVCLLEEEIADGRIGRDEFIIIGERRTSGFPCRVSSRLYPDWPFARLADTPRDLAKSVAASLLAMPAADGRAWTAPQDYSSVHALFRQLGLAPYERHDHPTLTGLIRSNWQWLVAAVLGVVWWIVHVARVENLVRRRTAELTREIAEREKAETAARLHREQRDQFSRLGILGEMASNIAHELNQPLAAIANYAEGMTRMLDARRDTPALMRDGARGVAEQAQRAAAIIQRIRSFVRRREAKRERVDPNDIIRETLALFEGLAARRGIALRVQLGDDVPNVLADRVEIEQVLLNLLQNAVDAMVDAGIAEKGVTIRSSRMGAAAKIAVRDNGPGLTPEVEAHLFETFFTTKPQGLGLGLSICRTIIESHGGRLWAANNADCGLTMRFTLPEAQSEAKA